MTLYIDESGNTGETLSKDSKFNFAEQPHYVLSGVLLSKEIESQLKNFITELVSKYRIQGNELKAKNLYDSNPNFSIGLVDFIIANEIPFFIELMDKVFYMHIQLVEYFILPYYSLPLNNKNIVGKSVMASTLGQFLNSSIYQKFVDTIKSNSHTALEDFYEILICHFDSIGAEELRLNVEQTKDDYFAKKVLNREQALKEFFPIPDENPNKRLIHLLPNYSAFTNLIARAQKYRNDFLKADFNIVHDEQKQFDIIFQSALERMKNTDLDQHVENTFVTERATFNVDNTLKLKFVDSKTNLFIQTSDLLSGLVMRFWNDFVKGKEDKVNQYMPVMNKLFYPWDGKSAGINFVVPGHDHLEFITRTDFE